MIVPPQPTTHHEEINSLFGHVLSRRTQAAAFTSIAIKPTLLISNARSFPLESMHSKLAVGLPIIMDAHASILNTCAGNKPRPIMGHIAYSIQSHNPKAVVQNTEYSNEMSYQFDGNETNHVYTSASDDAPMSRFDISKIDFSLNKEFQGYENPSSCSTLKLTLNGLNFFHTSHIVCRKARVVKSQMSEFERLMDVGTVLLKEGEQGLDGRLEVGVAARMLREAGARFASASAIDPLSLAAIDAWGVTFLVHGKLKLLLTEKLRDMLLEAKAQGPEKDSNVQIKLSSIEGEIPKLCEECEKLLVEAGRKFGMAISMDQRDDLALFNWGLALFYRARLIAADDLEDAAQDADKIYMTAIEKFKATSKLSKEYSGAAFLYWGLALRDQCWLHNSMATEEKIKLLERARWALEQALQVHPNSIEANCALEACGKDVEQLQNNSNAGQRALKKGRSQKSK